MGDIIRIVLADDQPFVRQGLKYIIDSQPDMVLMDIQMPNATGLEATRRILQNDPKIKIVLLTTFDVENYVVEGIRAGAVGYLLKDTAMQEILSGIRWSYQGHAIYRTPSASKAVAEAVLNSQKPSADERSIHAHDSLTERELSVLQELAYGRRNSEIAERFHISEGTVKTHIHRILQKLEVEDRTQAVVLAIRTGIVE